MSRTTGVLVLAAAWLAWTPRAAGDDSSIQCDGGIVSVGDSKLDLLGKCGEPTLVEKRGGKRRPAFSTVELWTYNFGPNRFLQFVTLIEGKVAAVDRGGYGYPPEQVGASQESGRPRCDAAALRVGDGKIDLLAKCGKPALEESRLEKRPGGTGSVLVRVDVWTYDFGPQHFVHFVTFENGRVARVERGGSGYAR